MLQVPSASETGRFKITHAGGAFGGHVTDSPLAPASFQPREIAFELVLKSALPLVGHSVACIYQLCVTGLLAT